MNFLKRILGLGPSTIDLEPRPLEPIPPKPPPAEVVELPKSRGYPMEVVGESFYQENFERICGPRTRDGEDRIVDAVLVLDDGNRHDALAVRVEVDGLPVGHLSREIAPNYRAYLKSIDKANVRGTCKARIKGGWQRGRDDVGSYGIYLSVKLP